MTSSPQRTKSLFQFPETTNHNVEHNSHHLIRAQNDRQVKYDTFLKCLSIFTNMAVGSIVIYNLYYINRHLIELKDAVNTIF